MISVILFLPKPRKWYYRDRLKTDNGWNEKKPLISSGNMTSAPQIEDFIHLLCLNFCF
ncbi:unnamed protein product, partial [Nesidiocoris tenuis]